MAVDHYENFPVASILLPARLRPAVEAIYAFARSADDIADEGDATPTRRLDQLARFDAALDAIALGEPVSDPLFSRLANAVARFDLPLQPLRDLISAFSQDVVKTRYRDFDELLDYCRRSANPVGRLMLHLYGAASPENLQRADLICSGLQIINFLQDVAVDWQKGRVYLPQDDLARFGVIESEIAAAQMTPQWRALMKFEIARARSMMLRGSSLARVLPGRIGWELRLVVLGGLRVLDKIAAIDDDVFLRRPTLKAHDWALLSWRALFSYPRLI